ncbi:uncharacterized protein LOC143236495 [Tachypleus tridentatus]|uniref:uncharacterized protein LOC143236495 n=1 Tax=Tachypleus tridentatus TaxID=6853 RepID=UPI003FD56357
MTVLVIHILFWNIVMSWFLVNGRTLGDRTIDLALTRKKLGKLDFSLFGSQNSSSGTYNLGLGVGGKLLQSKDDRIGIGVGVFMQQGVKPFSVGRLFSGSPTLGVGAGFNVKLGKKSNVNVGVSATKGLEKGPISTVVRVQYKFKRSVKNKK